MRVFNIFKKKTNYSLQSPKKDTIGQHVIRDFIYLDIERIRSYVSQFYGGLTTQRTSSEESKGSVSGSVEAGVPFGLKLGADINRYLLKSNQETKSLHDHIFDEFYRALLSTNSLSYIPDTDEHQWDESMFVDGSFLMVKGAIRLIDYKYITNFLDVLPSITGTLERVASTSSDPHSRKQREEASGLKKQISQMPIKELAKILTEFYGDTVRAKFYPFADKPQSVFVGSADRDYFRYNPIALMQMYGYLINAGWTAVLQVNLGSHSPSTELSSAAGASIESSIDQLVIALSDVHQTTQGINFPAVAVTTIAIFRETALGR